VNAEEPFIDSKGRSSSPRTGHLAAEDAVIDEDDSINASRNLFINAKLAKSASEDLLFDAKHPKSHAEDLMIDATNAIEASEDLPIDAQHSRTTPVVQVSDRKASRAGSDDPFIMLKERCASALDRCTATSALTLDAVQARLTAKHALSGTQHSETDHRSPITDH
jgi:hypothetical protein